MPQPTNEQKELVQQHADIHGDDNLAVQAGRKAALKERGIRHPQHGDAGAYGLEEELRLLRLFQERFADWRPGDAVPDELPPTEDAWAYLEVGVAALREAHPKGSLLGGDVCLLREAYPDFPIGADSVGWRAFIYLLAQCAERLAEYRHLCHAATGPSTAMGDQAAAIDRSLNQLEVRGALF